VIERTKQAARQYFTDLRDDLLASLDKELALTLTLLESLKYSQSLSPAQVRQVQDLEEGRLNRLQGETVARLLDLADKEKATAGVQARFEELALFYQQAGKDLSARVADLLQSGPFRALTLRSALTSISMPTEVELPSQLVTQPELVSRLTLLLRRRGLQAPALRLIFRASEHGFKALSFHRLCDGQGPLLLLCKSEAGELFGGFTGEARFNCEGEFVPDHSGRAFLFSLSRNLVFGIHPDRLGRALLGNPKMGPEFGDGCDLYLSDQCHQNRLSGSRLGKAYRLPEGVAYDSPESKALLAED
jgi:hypothetical protein